MIENIINILEISKNNYIPVTIIIVIIILLFIFIFYFGYTYGKGNCEYLYDKIGDYSVYSDVIVDNNDKIIYCSDNKCSVISNGDYNNIGNYKFLKKDIIIDGLKIIPNPDIYIKPLRSNNNLLMLDYNNYYIDCCSSSDTKFTSAITNSIQFVNNLSNVITSNSIINIKYSCNTTSGFINVDITSMSLINSNSIELNTNFKIIKINKDNINTKKKLSYQELNDISIINVNDYFSLIYTDQNDKQYYVYKNEDNFLKIKDTFINDKNHIFKCINSSTTT
jgi:hypothetical protein